MNNYKKLSIVITILTILITMFLLLNINIRDKELRKLQQYLWMTCLQMQSDAFMKGFPSLSCLIDRQHFAH